MTTRRPRVALVVNSLARAGAERMAVDLACALDAREWDVQVFVVRDGPLRGQLEAVAIPVHVIGGEFDWRWLGIVRRLTRQLKEFAPDVVHTNLIGSDVVGGIAARLAGVPVVITTQHDSYKRPLVFDWYRRWAAHRLGAVVAVAPGLLEYCRRDLHMPAERTLVIANGVDVESFSSARHEQTRPPVYGAVGSLIGVKGHSTLIEAFAIIHAQDRAARLLIAGEGVERVALQSLIEKRGLIGAVQLTGIVHNIAAFLARLDIFVQPSLQEGLPLAVLEAMAARKPVIASDLATLRALLDRPDVHPGVLVPPGDVGALAAAMKKLAASTEYAEELGIHGLRLVTTEYSRQRMADEYAALYRRLLAERASTNR